MVSESQLSDCQSESKESIDTRPPKKPYTKKAKSPKKIQRVIDRVVEPKARKKPKPRPDAEIASDKPGTLPLEKRYEGRLEKSLVPSDYSVADWIDMALDRFACETDKEYFRDLLVKIVEQNAAPMELFAELPLPTQESGKTRFDQIYEAMQYISFPPYSKAIITALLGENINPHIKVWRVSLPEKFKVANCLIRAETYQDAFALACDYACRIHLRLFKSIPKDLTIRVAHMSSVAIAKYLGIRKKIRNQKSRVYASGVARQFTPKQVLGARTAALGHSFNDPRRSIAIYADRQDMHKARRYQGMIRMISVELESHVDHPERGKTHAEKLREHSTAHNPQEQDKENGDANE